LIWSNAAKHEELADPHQKVPALKWQETSVVFHEKHLFTAMACGLAGFLRKYLCTLFKSPS
jgi:hypothetical protein